MTPDKQAAPISVVITTFNDGTVLAEALHSVAAQTVLPKEILVIDDGSEPATAPLVIDSFRVESGLHAACHWQRNAGPSAARNAGLRQATQEYVAFLDADDLWLPQHLEWKLGRLRARDATYSTAYDGFVEFDHGSKRALRTIATGSHDGLIRAELLGMPGGVPAGMPFQLHRRAALQAVGGFDESLRVNEDFDLLLRLARAGYRITGSATPTVRRRVHPGSATRRDAQRTLEETERFLAKAERQALLSADVVASRRKWLRLSIGKQQVLNDKSLRQGIATLKDAFQFGRPAGLAQWAVFLAASNALIGYPFFRAFRTFQRVRRLS
jgi:glycosyltransferase involved in cell wall biosynthesis